MAKASQKIYHRSLTRKNPQTGKSNYPTVVTRRTTITNSNYVKRLKTTTRKVYKRIIKTRWLKELIISLKTL